jgi:glycine oxidase
LKGEIYPMSQGILIVGHGLAGAILAHSLLECGENVRVIDSCSSHSATQVSAGLINPFIGPKLNMPTDFDRCMDANLSLYEMVEKYAEQKFLRSIELFRVFQSATQKDRWDNLLSPYKKKTVSSEQCSDSGLLANYGAGVTKAWKFDSQGFINFSKESLSSQDRFNETSFDPKRWTDHMVVFCEGFRVLENEWFNNLPFAPAQGDVLSIESPNDIHASNGTWHIPEGIKGLARIGSTWRHDNLESGPSPSARDEILKRLQFIPSVQNALINLHLSGVRSGTKDRNPIIGRHPEIKNFFLFNGFGSRGCSTIPLAALEFTNFITHGTPLPQHKNLSRFM